MTPRSPRTAATADSHAGPGRVRPRRLRTSAALRRLVAETRVAPGQLVMPHFVLPSRDAQEPIDAMPGISRLGIEPLLAAVEGDLELGIAAVLVFGLVGDERKD